MFFIPEQVSSATKARISTHLETLTSLGTKTFENIEQIVDLNLGLLRASLEESAQTARQLCSARDAKEIFAVGAAQIKPASEKLLTYGRHLAGIASAARGDLSKVTDERVTNTNRNAIGIVESVAKNAPVGSEQAVAMLKAAVGNANAGYQQFSKTTRLAVAAIEANLASAVSRLASSKAKTPARARK